MPSRKHKEKYAFGIITLFPSLKDPYSPKGYVSIYFLYLYIAIIINLVFKHNLCNITGALLWCWEGIRIFGLAPQDYIQKQSQAACQGSVAKARRWTEKKKSYNFSSRRTATRRCLQGGCIVSYPLHWCYKRLSEDEDHSWISTGACAQPTKDYGYLQNISSLFGCQRTSKVFFFFFSHVKDLFSY